MSSLSSVSGRIDIVGLGSCTVDFFALVSKLIGADEKINATGFEIHAGGVTANNLTQVARLGASAAWIGLLGDDDNARIIRQAFADDGMDLGGIEAVPGERSSFTWIPVDSGGERSIYMFPNITARVTPEQIRTRFAAHIRGARHFHTEASQLPMAPVLEAMRLARDAGVRVIFDLDVAPGDFIKAGLSTEAQMMEALLLSDVLKPCKAAARELTGQTDYGRIAARLLEMGPGLVAITMGSEGCVIAGGGKNVHAPSYRVNVVDTTGAGDAFMGGLSFALLRGADFQGVGAFANACAALCCTRVGARAMARLSEVEALVNSRATTSTVG
jgi:sugar/nucleoside kinase (ribokinase family)